MLRKLKMEVLDQFDQGFGEQAKEWDAATYAKHLVKTLGCLKYAMLSHRKSSYL